ncbi:hypothetical protein TDB9533_02105 [Thalassocella blandensis]|nr:hypothetical protein TDB9533_02105 [Thalassocella blandensis]
MHDETEKKVPSDTVRVTELTLFPVKSCAGIALEQASLNEAGLEFMGIYDRSWAICKPNQHLLTQRQNPQLALITPRISQGQLYLYHERAGEILLPAINTLEQATTTALWKDFCPALQAPEAVNQWLRQALNTQEELSLVAIDTKKPRDFIHPTRFDVNTNYFSDAAPFLITNQSSLTALNQALQDKQEPSIDMRRFRSNINIEGLPAFTEHQVQALHHERYSLGLVDHCQRCIMTTVDPDKGEFSDNREPFMTIPQLNGMPNKPKAPAFGVNARLAIPGRHSINVGDILNTEWQ